MKNKKWKMGKKEKLQQLNDILRFLCEQFFCYLCFEKQCTRKGGGGEQCREGGEANATHKCVESEKNIGNVASHIDIDIHVHLDVERELKNRIEIEIENIRDVYRQRQRQ